MDIGGEGREAGSFGEGAGIGLREKGRLGDGEGRRESGGVGEVFCWGGCIEFREDVKMNR